MKKLFNVTMTKHVAGAATQITDSMMAENHYQVATEMERRHSGEVRDQRVTDMVIVEAD